MKDGLSDFADAYTRNRGPSSDSRPGRNVAALAVAETEVRPVGEGSTAGGSCTLDPFLYRPW